MDFPQKNVEGNPQDIEKKHNEGLSIADLDRVYPRTLSVEMQEITDWLSKVKFRRQWFGGLDERSVWNKIKELNTMYEHALEAERIRYNALLEEYRQNNMKTASCKEKSLEAEESYGQPPESR
jgi:hypothetical protein